MKAIAWILTLLYIPAAVFVWMCYVRDFCLDTPTQAPASQSYSLIEGSAGTEVKLQGHFPYAWSSTTSSADSLGNKAFTAFAQTLKQHPEWKLGIVGLYAKKETHTSSALNLGLSRARHVRDLFLDQEVSAAQLIPLYRTIYGKTPGDTLDEAMYFLLDSMSISSQVLQEGEIFRFDAEGSNISLTPKNEAFLIQLVHFLRQNPDQKVVIEGHTHTQGSASNNIVAGEKFAQTGQDMLTQLGVDKTQVSPVSMGETQPLVKPESSASDRQKNQRLHIHLVE